MYISYICIFIYVSCVLQSQAPLVLCRKRTVEECLHYLYLGVSRDTPKGLLRNVYITGWRRLIGSPKLQIIFHKRATKYRSLLRKMTYKDKGSYESSPPCNVDIPQQSFCGTKPTELEIAERKKRI